MYTRGQNLKTLVGIGVCLESHLITRSMGKGSQCLRQADTQPGLRTNFNSSTCIFNLPHTLKWNDVSSLVLRGQFILKINKWTK